MRSWADDTQRFAVVYDAGVGQKGIGVAIGEDDNGWYLHSQGRRFGPLSEDDLRGYFRAGMVKSVDRISVPGQDAMLAAGDVAAMLGVTAPVGPPPPPLPAASAGPTAPVAAAAPRTTTGDAAGLDERAAKAIAAMELELATMAMSSSRRKSSGWLVPMVAAIALIGMLFFGLSMVRNLGSGPAAATADEAKPPPSADRMPIEAVIEASKAPASGDAEAWYQKGQQLTDSGNWAALAQHATQWTQADPNSVQAWQALGLAQVRLGQIEEAVAALERVLRAEPENSNARILLAETYMGAARWGEAAGHYKVLVAALPESPRLWNNYGVVLGNLGQGAQSIAALETAVRIDPGFGSAWTNLGLQYQAVGDADRAAAAFERAKSLR